MQNRSIEVCLTPALFPYRQLGDALVVVVDVLRATTSICTAFEHGVEAILPVATLEEARALKQQGYLVAAERDGQVLDFADFGNSAFNFMNNKVKGKTIVYSTTNGTQTIQMAAASGHLVSVGAFSNISALVKFASNWHGNLTVLCSGWKNRFNLEDTVFAGALAQRLIEEAGYQTRDDATQAAVGLWNQAKGDLQGYLLTAEHHERLKKLNLDDVLPYTFTLDTCLSVPVLEERLLTDYRNRKL